MKDGASVRMGAVGSIGSVRPVTSENVTALTEALADKDLQFRAAVANALGEMGPDAKAAITPLTMVLNGSDPGPRIAAAGALWRIDGQKDAALPILLKYLREGDPNQRTYAAWIPGKIGRAAKDAIGDLTQSLHDQDRGVRLSVATALCKVNGPKEAAMKVLLDELGKNGESKYDVLWTLNQLGSDAKDAAPAVRGLTRHKDRFVRQKALETLKKIDPKGSVN